MTGTISLDSLVTDLRKMGISEGDTLFVRAALSKVARMRSNGQLILNALLQAVGREGTLVSLSYTKSFFLRADRNFVFTRDTVSTAGALPNIMLKHPDSQRSRHPTNSLVAIGAKAAFIVNDHDETSPAYEPIRRLVELRAKMMLIGCVQSSPGFTTAHLAEQDLGLQKRVIFPTLNVVYYKDPEGIVRLFKRRDLGLCSNSFSKFYSHYLSREILTTGLFGNAYSILVPAYDAYVLEKSILQKNPRFNICDDPDCVMCNCRRWDRLHKLPRFITRRLYARLIGNPGSGSQQS